MYQQLKQPDNATVLNVRDTQTRADRTRHYCFLNRYAVITDGCLYHTNCHSTCHTLPKRAAFAVYKTSRWHYYPDQGLMRSINRKLLIFIYLTRGALLK